MPAANSAFSVYEPGAIWTCVAGAGGPAAAAIVPQAVSAPPHGPAAGGDGVGRRARRRGRRERGDDGGRRATLRRAAMSALIADFLTVKLSEAAFASAELPKAPVVSTP